MCSLPGSQGEAEGRALACPAVAHETHVGLSPGVRGNPPPPMLALRLPGDVLTMVWCTRYSQEERDWWLKMMSRLSWMK